MGEGIVKFSRFLGGVGILWLYEFYIRNFLEDS